MFDQIEKISIQKSNDKFQVYISNAKVKPKSLFVFHHGAGHCGLVWALCCAHIIKILATNDVALMAFDWLSECSDELDLSLHRLTSDMVEIVNACFPTLPSQIILAGHSLGGSIVVDIAKQRLLKNIIGVCVLDVVEGTAMDSLKHMQQFLNSRPLHFKSLDAAISYSVKTNTIRNIESARISIPSQLRAVRLDNDSIVSATGRDSMTKETTTLKDTEAVQKTIYTWRTDLSKTKAFWPVWFQGLSLKFLSIPAGRMLMLASTDRLDNALMVGQMQGKFQLVLFNDSGHSIHEDAPEKVATALVDFLQRNQPMNIKLFDIPLNPKSFATSPMSSSITTPSSMKSPRYE